MINGVVYRSTGSWYDVKLEDGTLIKSRIKGKFRTKGLRTTNPLAVGDYVHLIKNDIGEYIVDEIQERKNYIIRKSVNLSKEAHIIASNIDLALLLVTISNPATATGFIDRFTVTAEAYHIPLHIVFNKLIYMTIEIKRRYMNGKVLIQKPITITYAFLLKQAKD